MTNHHPDFDKLVGPDRRRPRLGWLGGSIAGVAVLLLIGLIWLWPRGEPNVDYDVLGFPDDTAPATVQSVEITPCEFAPAFDCRISVVVVTGGTYTGEEVVLESAVEGNQSALEVGDQVLLSVLEYPDGTVTFQYADRDRRLMLGVLTVIFAVTVVILGRLKGLAALAGLAISIGVLMLFILPAIIRGSDAVLVALVGGGVIALVTLYVAHGYSPKTHAAALGIFSALVLTVLLSWLVVALAAFSGLASDEAYFLIAVPDLDLSGLILAGIVLGALGALDDVTVTQASAVWEVNAANPGLGPDGLFQSGIRIGRDHIVSTVNTLLLAYAGASLPLLILFTLSAQSMGVVASSEVVAVEIVRTLVGSIGLVAAVPITTWVASRIAPSPPAV